MPATAKKTDPKLWDQVKQDVTKADKGGRPGQWSARKAQLATQAYKAQGGGYEGRKDPENHLRQWTDQDWGTKSGRDSNETGERYLPRQAREHLSDKEYAKTTAKKRADTAKGKQYSRQPAGIAAKTALDRQSKADLLRQAAQAGIRGRSRMTKPELIKALG